MDNILNINTYSIHLIVVWKYRYKCFFKGVDEVKIIEYIFGGSNE